MWTNINIYCSFNPSWQHNFYCSRAILLCNKIRHIFYYLHYTDIRIMWIRFFFLTDHSPDDFLKHYSPVTETIISSINIWIKHMKKYCMDYMTEFLLYTFQFILVTNCTELQITIEIYYIYFQIFIFVQLGHENDYKKFPH